MRPPPSLPLALPHRWSCRTTRCRFVVLLGLLVWCALGTRLAWSVSLPEAVTSALASSPLVLAAEKQKLIEEQQTKQAFAGYLPAVDLYTSTGTEQDNNPTTRAINKGAVSVSHTETRASVNQMLFDGFAVSSGVKKARALEKAAAWAYQATAQTVAMDTTEQFLEVQKQRELLSKIKQFVDVHADFLTKVREWYEGGAGTVAEVWQTESRLALTQSSMATVESQLASAMDEFTRTVGRRPDQLDPVPSVAASLPHSLEQALALAAQHHPTLLEAQSNLEAAEAARAVAEATFWPAVSLALETDRVNNASGVDGDVQTNSAMLRVNYNLFRGGTDRAKGQEFRRRQEQSEAQIDQARQTVQKNVEKSWRTIQELRQRLALLQQHEAVSKQVADAYYEQFIADQRSLLDVLNAENELFTAKSNRVSGDYALQVEEYRLLANIGIMDTVMPLAPSPRPDAGPLVAQDMHLTLQDAWLTPATPITLYETPKTAGAVVKELPKQTPVRILQTQGTWIQVVDAAGNQGWMPGLSTASKPLSSGMFTFQSPDSGTPAPQGPGNTPGSNRAGMPPAPEGPGTTPGAKSSGTPPAPEGPGTAPASEDSGTTPAAPEDPGTTPAAPEGPGKGLADAP
ncbi:MAG: TolC family outer membrane protein [Magnetococcales bacterium]|nr:TolC family outer membrane protein [Magnetococcales bacterium]